MDNKDDILIEVKGVSKKFSRSLKQGMWYGLKDVIGSIAGIGNNSSVLRRNEFWAVKDINFTLRRGECLGIIGRNGAGKSTLLKMLNGLIKPDEGAITIRGKIGALIELGAGFNPLLTGRENIYVNGQILGFTKKEIDAKMEAILDFAEINEFIDAPIQNYSSGMKVRLGFAVAAQMEPDVLLIDEVLAVGDLGFVLKCFNTIDDLMKKTAVIFVSHNMPQVSRISSDIMLLEQGKIAYHSTDVGEGVDVYYSRFKTNENKHVVFNRGGDAEVLELCFGANNNGGIYSINRLDDLVINIRLKVKQELSFPFVSVYFYDKEQRPIATCESEQGLNENNIYKKEGGYTFYSVKIV